MSLLEVAVFCTVLGLCAYFVYSSMQAGAPSSEVIEDTTEAAAETVELQQAPIQSSGNLEPQELTGVGSGNEASLDGINYLGPIAVTELPSELHAKSAIQISGSLGSEVESFSIPISSHARIDLAVSKTVEKSPGRVVLFGGLSNGEKSHYSFVLNQGALASGNLILFESNEHYRIVSLPDGRLVVSRTDPNFETPLCGCAGCSSESGITLK